MKIETLEGSFSAKSKPIFGNTHLKALAEIYLQIHTLAQISDLKISIKHCHSFCKNSFFCLKANIWAEKRITFLVENSKLLFFHQFFC